MSVAVALVTAPALHTSETRPLPAARPAAMRELRSSRARFSSASLARLASISARRRVSDADMAAGGGVRQRHGGRREG